jgi:hypothetical protein
MILATAFRRILAVARLVRVEALVHKACGRLSTAECSEAAALRKVQQLTADLAKKNQEIAFKVSWGRSARPPLLPHARLTPALQQADLRAAHERLAVLEAERDAAERHAEECAAAVGKLEVCWQREGGRHVTHPTDPRASCTGARRCCDDEGRRAGRGG